jgi:F-type H+-transporting ATPase subunit epsilon
MERITKNNLFIMKTFTLTIARVDGPLFAGEVKSVVLPGSDGEMTILPDHTALITPLRTGTLTVTEADGSTRTFPVTTGTLEVSANRATILL